MAWVDVCTGLAAPRHVGSSQTKGQTHVPCTGRQILYHWATRLPLYWKGKGCGWLLQISWCRNLFAAIQAGLITMLLYTCNRTLVFCSVTFYLNVNGKVLYFKGQALEAVPWELGYSVCFRPQETFFFKRCRALMTQHRQQSTGVRDKGVDPIWSQVCSSLLQVIFVFIYRSAHVFIYKYMSHVNWWNPYLWGSETSQIRLHRTKPT